MTKKTMALVGVLAAVLVLGAGMAFGMSRMHGDEMGQGQSMMASHMGTGMMGGQMMGGQTMMHGGQGSGSVPAAIAGAREVTVTADNLAFTPNAISVKPGEAVNVAFHNADEMVHDFTIPSLGVHVDAQPGQTVTFGLQVATSGTYEFMCTVPGHAAAGMHGTITAAS